MARNEIDVPAPPEAVFEVLSDPGAYAYWVVGARRVRDADREWPRADSVLHHTQGVWPIGLDDSSTVIECERDRHLALRVCARPFVVARVDLDLEPIEGGTRVVMLERTIGGLVGRFVPEVLVSPGLRLRNALTLRRLRRLAVERTERPATA